jgi:hypothetical protein
MVNTTHSILLGVYSMSRGNMFFLDLEPTPSVIMQSGDDKYENCGSKREMWPFAGYAALL